MIDTVREVLFWCFIINFGLLLWWFLFIIFARDWTYRLHSKWFKLSIEQFDAIHYAGIALFKLSIFSFYLVPYFALLIVS